MNTRRIEMLLWLTGVVALACALAGSLYAVPPVAAIRAAIPSAVALATRVTGDTLSAAAERIAAHNPFRLDRRPAAVAFTPVLEGMPAPPPPPPKPPQPALSLAGILGGPPWEALVDGIPGREGSVLVRRGERFAGLMVRSVSRDTVVIAGQDTVWRLTLKKTWH